MKKVIKNIKENISDVICHFPLTCLCILIGTILLEIGINVYSPFLTKVFLFLVLFASPCILIESYNEGFKKKSIIWYCISIIVSVGLVLFYSSSNALVVAWTKRIIASYIVTFICLTLLVLYKKSQLSLEEYILNSFVSSVKVFIIDVILMIGMTLVLSMFTLLLFDIPDVFERILIFINCLYFLPSIINSFRNVNIEPEKFFRVIFRYVLSILLIIAFIVIYIYLLKIFITFNIPSNEIFRILSILFFIGLPIWTISSNYYERDFLSKINNKLPIIFIPCIFLEIYALLARIIDCGFTEMRYVGIFIILFQIIYICLYMFKKDKLYYAFIIIPSIVIFTLICPYMNMYSVSVRSQYSILKSYLNKENITLDDQSIILSSYDYLKYNTYGKEKLNKLSEDELKDIEEYSTNIKEEDYPNVKEYNHINKEVNIHGYSKLVPFTLDWDFTIEDFKNKYGYDFENLFIEEVIKKGLTADEYFSNINFIECGEDKIILTYVNFNYMKNGDEYKLGNYYDIRGYLLEK